MQRRTAVEVAVVIIGGVWLRWAMQPALSAFRLGMVAGGINATQKAAWRGIGLPPEVP